MTGTVDRDIETGLREALDHFNPAPFADLYAAITPLPGEDDPELASLHDQLGAVVEGLRTLKADTDLHRRTRAFVAEYARLRGQLVHVIEALHAKVDADREQWSADPFWWGYECGKQHERAVIAEALAAIVNNTLVRVGE